MRRMEALLTEKDWGWFTHGSCLSATDKSAPTPPHTQTDGNIHFSYASSWQMHSEICNRGLPFAEHHIPSANSELQILSFFGPGGSQTKWQILQINMWFRSMDQFLQLIRCDSARWTPSSCTRNHIFVGGGQICSSGFEVVPSGGYGAQQMEDPLSFHWNFPCNMNLW